MKARVLALALLLSGAVVCAGQEPIQRLALGTGEWEPLSCETMPGYGIVSEIVQGAFKAAGIETTLKFFPWKRCEAALQAGEVDAIYPYRRNEERLQVYDFSSGILATRSVLFFLKGTFDPAQYTRFEDLRKFRVGGVIGSWYEKDLREARIPVDYVPTFEQNLAKLLAHRIDLAMLTDVNGWYLIKNRFAGDYARFGAVDYRYPNRAPTEQELMNCLVVSKKDVDGRRILEAFNAGLKLIRANGTFDAILARHGLKGGR